jgi:NDP-sugar pyrophosphorylase family protein
LQFPKALTPVLGVPVVQFSIDLVNNFGAREVVYNNHYLSESLRRGLSHLDTGQLRLYESLEYPQILGSAGGVLAAMKYMKEGPILVLNADVMCPFDLKALVDRHAFMKERHGSQLTMALLERAPGTGLYPEIGIEGAENKVRCIGKPNRGKVFFTGAYIVEPKVFEKFLPGAVLDMRQQFFDPLISGGKVAFEMMNVPWIDVGSPELLWGAHFEMIRRIESAQCPRIWENRILLTSEPVSQGCWRSKRSRWFRNNISGAPGFYDLTSEEQSHLLANEPHHVVVYEPLNEVTSYSIQFSRSRVSCGQFAPGMI